MKIAIIGTGGVGGYFGGKLAKAGHDVTFLARGQHLQAIQQNGLTVNSINGNFVVQPAQATSNITSIGVCDLIIIAVKAWQINEIGPELSAISDKHTMILPLQNGIMATRELQSFVAPSCVLSGLCRIISLIEAPGIISHLGVEPTILFGETNYTSSNRTQLLESIFNKAGIKAHIAKDIEAEIWKKFIPICVSGLLAVTRANYGEIRDQQELHQLMTELINEIYTLSQAAGISIQSDFPHRAIEFINSFPANSTSSLTRDVLANKPSEIEYQNGTVVKLGQQYGISTPINRFVYYAILPGERRARKKLITN